MEKNTWKQEMIQYIDYWFTRSTWDLPIHNPVVYIVLNKAKIMPYMFAFEKKDT